MQQEVNSLLLGWENLQFRIAAFGDYNVKGYMDNSRFNCAVIGKRYIMVRYNQRVGTLGGIPIGHRIWDTNLISG